MIADQMNTMTSLWAMGRSPKANPRMTSIAGDLAGFEEATRALFASNQGRFDELIAPWPADVRNYAKKLAADAFATAEAVN